MITKNAYRKAIPTSLRRGLRILRAFADQKDGWGVRELAAELKMHPSSVHRILSALASEGLFDYDHSWRKYRVGIELFRISAIIHQKFPLTEVARPFMKDLARECGETVLLGLYNPRRLNMSIVSQAESTNPLRYVLKLGAQFPLHAGAGPLAILAFLDPETIESILAKPLARLTKQTLTDPAAVRESLLRIRNAGYAVSMGHVLEDAVAIAAPVWDSKGVIGSLNVPIPRVRYRRSIEKTFGRQVRSTAIRISTALGFRAPAKLE